jgi:ferric-dicitrate binding protein FerR (iron transport regulator)
MCCKKNPDEKQLLKPGQRATVDKVSGKIRVESYEVSNSMKWTNGRLLFDGEPLPDIVKTLERSYNVKITIADCGLRKLRFYGDFIRQEQTLVEVLDALESTGKLRYERNGKNVILLNPK